MKIRKQLTLLFIGIVILILTITFLSIYFFSATYRKDDFYLRLSNKANNIAKLLIEVEEIDVPLLSKIEKNNPVSLPRERVIVYNYRNEILYSTDSLKAIEVTNELLNKIRLQKEVRYTQGEYEVYGTLFTDQFDRFVVLAAAVDIYGWRKMKNLQTILGLSFIISVVVVSAAGWIYAGNALVPISEVVEQVDNITASSLNLRVQEGNKKDEIARLAITFNQMLDRLEEAFAVQKEFIANASHELRTPLTAITGKIEITLLQKRTTEKYEEVLKELHEEVKGINKLANGLLLLAQASDEGSVRSFVPVRIDEMLWQAQSELMKSSSVYQVNIAFDPPLDDVSLSVNGDEQLLKAAFLNLMENACKYSDDNQVDVRVFAENSSVILEFSDKGMGISDKEMDTIFEPFVRGENTRNIRGHGIGLSLTNRIIKLHKGNIEVQSIVGKGSVFTVQVPTGM